MMYIVYYYKDLKIIIILNILYIYRTYPDIIFKSLKYSTSIH